MKEKIDFVITWVDGNDIKWQKEKEKYEIEKIGHANSKNRYRDWENLQYIFRGIEKYAPWVNKVHLVTFGHIPKWINLKNEKLNIVKHESFIPKEYLPTFNSNAIEINIDKIEGLSEEFVLFNDDMFIIEELKTKDFFKNGKPCKDCIADIFTPVEMSEFSHILLNNSCVINKYYKRNEFLKKNFFKVFNLKYGKRALKNLCFLEKKQISTFNNNHLPNPFLKDTYRIIWEKEFEIMNTTSKNKFRSCNEINQYIFEYWQYITGNFETNKYGIGKKYELSNDNEWIWKDIKKKKYKMICLNDSNLNINFEIVKKEVNRYLNNILPDKSTFEI